MRLRISLASILIYAILSPPACHPKREGNENLQARPTAQTAPSTAEQTTPLDGVRRIRLAELRDALTKGEAVVVDVRGEVEYSLGHIKGALSMPLGLIKERAASLPRDKLIVTYCA
jgi:3-mercaptopyruvate sulfurtransferase SseA